MPETVKEASRDRETFQGHEGASIRGACVPVTFSFSRRKSHGARRERKKNPRRCASEIARHVPYNTHTRVYAPAITPINFPVASFFPLSLLDESQLSLFSLLFPGNKEAIFEKMVFEDDRSTSYHYERVYDDSLITDNFRGKKSRSNYVNPVSKGIDI